VVWAWHETNKANTCTGQSNLTRAEGMRFLYEPGKFQVTNEMKQQFEKAIKKMNSQAISSVSNFGK